MGLPSFPAALLHSQYEKVKGVQDKPTGIADALKALKKAYDGIDGNLLEFGKLESPAAIGERRDALQGAGRQQAKALADKATALAALVKKWEPEFKRMPAVAKTAAPATAEVGKLAGELAAAVGKALDAGIAELATRQAKAAAAKPAGGTAPAKGAAPSPEFKQVRTKVLESLRIVRANAPGTPPIQALVALGSGGCAIYMAKSVSASHKTLLQALLPGVSGLKYAEATCIWEEKCHTFVGESLPGGAGKRIQAALLALIGSKIRVRVRRGAEVESEDGDADAVLPEDGDAGAAPAEVTPAAPAATAEPVGAAEAAKALQGRAAEVTAALLAAIKAGHPLAAQLKGKLAEALAAAKGPGGPAAALKAVDTIARALAMPAAKGAATKADDPALQGQWNRARDTWRAAIEAVDGRIAAVRERMLASGDADFRRVADRGLPALTDNHKTPVMRALFEIDGSSGDARRAAAQRGRAAVAAFRAHLGQSRLLATLDTHGQAAFGVNLAIRAGLEPGLAALDEALAALA